MERTPPHNIEAEQAVLSAVLLDNNSIDDVAEIIKAADFYLETHRTLWTAMMDMNGKGLPVDLVTLTDFLQVKGWLENVGGPANISSLAGQVSTASNIAHWGQIVRDKADLRAIITLAINMASKAFDEPENVEDLMERCEAGIMRITQRAGESETIRPLDEIATEACKHLRRIREQGITITGVPTGYKGIDYLTGGLQPSMMSLLAGRPSMGKSTLAVNIAVNAAKANYGVLFFSIENKARMLADIMLCAESGVPLHSARRGYATPNQLDDLDRGLIEIKDLPIWIDDDFDLSLLRIRKRTRRMIDRIQLVMVDYLQLARMEKEKGKSREQEVAAMSRGLKGLAKDLDIATLILAQLNRDVEKASRPPRLSDLRESGSLEQDADLIMFVHRPNVTATDGTEEESVVMIAKQRNGPTGNVPMRFERRYGRFKEEG